MNSDRDTVLGTKNTPPFSSRKVGDVLFAKDLLAQLETSLLTMIIQTEKSEDSSVSDATTDSRGSTHNRKLSSKPRSTSGAAKGRSLLRYDLLPVLALAEVALVYGLGAMKYAERNWEKGTAWSDLLSAMHRHIQKWTAGESFDPDGQHHLASVVFHALALMTYEVSCPHQDDRGKIRPVAQTHTPYPADDEIRDTLDRMAARQVREIM